MKKSIIITLLTLGLAVPIPALGQTTRSATLTWTDTLNPTGTTYNVYRASGLCSGTPVFSKLATGVAALTYKDTTVTIGNWCYQVSATSGGAEGPSSVPGPAAVLPAAVQNFQVTVP